MSEMLEKARKYEMEESMKITQDNRPVYHFSNPVGWMNDPNGFSEYKGEHHLFFQYYPYATHWDSMHWGHAKSVDFIKWEYLPVALAPDQDYDNFGVFSGSAIEDGEKQLLIYTGVEEKAAPNGEKCIRQNQCVAIGYGVDYEKIENNPAVTADMLPEGSSLEDFRDPKVWKKNGRWWMVVGAQTKELKGNVALFVSDDLKKWQWKGNMLDSSMDWGYMCECPDLADMGERQFLIVSRQKEDGCKGMVFAGIMDYEQGRFHISEDTGVLLDEGFDFYAPQTFTDESGRRLLMGWIGAGEIEYQMSQPTVKEGWLHVLTIPREVYVKNDRLYQKPAEELKHLRKNEESICGTGEIAIDRHSKCMEILAEGLENQTITFDFGKVIKFLYKKESGNLLVFRKKWNGEGYDEKEIHLDKLEDFRIYLDQSTAEIFLNQGEKVLTMKSYFTEDTLIHMNSELQIKVKTWLLEEE